MRVTSPLSERVYRVPAAEQRILGSRHRQHRTKQDPADPGKLIDDGPERRTGLDENRLDLGSMTAEAFEDRLIACLPEGCEALRGAYRLERDSDPQLTDRPEGGTDCLRPGPRQRGAATCDVAERTRESEGLKALDGAWVPEDPPDGRLD